MHQDVLIVGCGDIGLRVARILQTSSCEGAGLTRLAELPTGGKLVFYLAPPPGGGPVDGRMRNFCAAVSGEKVPEKVVYMSTSGVYGDCGGARVTEETPVNPQTSRAQRRVDAETTLLEWGRANKVPVVILRVTGIYGPGRLPLARLQQGHPVLNEKESPPTNRIHADDLAADCVAAAEKAADGEIFNVSDGQSGTMTGYFNAIADLLELPRPQQVSMAEANQVMNPMMLSYLKESRRMDNRKMIEQLGVVLQYPDLESGLKNIIEQLDQPGMGYLGSVGH